MKNYSVILHIEGRDGSYNEEYTISAYSRRAAALSAVRRVKCENDMDGIDEISVLEIKEAAA